MNLSLSFKKVIGHFCLLNLCFIAPLEAKTPENKAIWVVKDALSSPASVSLMLRKAKQTGFNIVLVQVRSRGDAYYKSRFVHVADMLKQGENAGFDPLRLAVKKGHQAGLQIHAWVNLFILWSSPYPPANPNHLFYLHPEWLACPDDGNPTAQEGIYLSPALPQVRGYLLGVIKEIIEDYQVDGIHLDYVRYPNNHYDYSPRARTNFMLRYAIDPLGLAQGSERVVDLLGAVGVGDLSQKWLAWRAGQVTKLVEAIHDLIQQTKPRIALSAAVKPDIEEAYRRYGQDWTRWANRGLVDFVIPMLYFRDNAKVMQQLRQAVRAVGRERLYAGIGAYNKPISETLNQIRKVESLGVKGICLFSYNSLEEEPGSFERLQAAFATSTGK